MIRRRRDAVRSTVTVTAVLVPLAGVALAVVPGTVSARRGGAARPRRDDAALGSGRVLDGRGRTRLRRRAAGPAGRRLGEPLEEPRRCARRPLGRRCLPGPGEGRQSDPIPGGPVHERAGGHPTRPSRGGSRSTRGSGGTERLPSPSRPPNPRVVQRARHHRVTPCGFRRSVGARGPLGPGRPTGGAVRPDGHTVVRGGQSSRYSWTRPRCPVRSVRHDRAHPVLFGDEDQSIVLRCALRPQDRFQRCGRSRGTKKPPR